MAAQTRKHWTRTEVTHQLGKIQKVLQKLDRQARQNKKIASADVIDAIADIQRPLQFLDDLSVDGGKMPAPLRKKLRATVAKIKDTERDFHDWAITETEKNKAVVKKNGRKRF